MNFFVCSEFVIIVTNIQILEVGLDRKFMPHRGEPYKNDILMEKQIRRGKIDDDIFYDHYISSSRIGAIIDDLKTQSPKIGDGDVNTQYTAFREFMEESCYIKDDDEIGYIFDLNTIFEKLYKNKSYMYLGGCSEYNYDMYVIFFTISDLDAKMLNWFSTSYNEIQN